MLKSVNMSKLRLLQLVKAISKSDEHIWILLDLSMLIIYLKTVYMKIIWYLLSVIAGDNMITVTMGWINI